MNFEISVESMVEETPRLEQVRGLFDLSPEKTSRISWSVNMPIEAHPWSIGLITGPSGCGKSTIARRAFADHLWLDDLTSWPRSKAIIDGFPDNCSIKDITALLSSVGFSSPPAWLRPYEVLSTGQKFRCDLARLIAKGIAREGREYLIFDEYTSVVDRTVAQIGSAAVAKAIRSRGLKFVAVTCHEDVEEWLEPDWIYRPAEDCFLWRSVQPRPEIRLDITRTTASAWRLFAPHHYLSDSLAQGAWCWLAHWRERPVGFSAWLPFVGQGPLSRREHRTVVLPDYQGVGIGQALCHTLAAMWRGLGYVARSTTTHPGLIQSRAKSPLWRCVRAPSLALGKERKVEFRKLKHAQHRLTAGWEYIGPALDRRTASLLHG